MSGAVQMHVKSWLNGPIGEDVPHQRTGSRLVGAPNPTVQQTGVWKHSTEALKCFKWSQTFLVSLTSAVSTCTLRCRSWLHVLQLTWRPCWSQCESKVSPCSLFLWTFRVRKNTNWHFLGKDLALKAGQGCICPTSTQSVLCLYF